MTAVLLIGTLPVYLHPAAVVRAGRGAHLGAWSSLCSCGVIAGTRVEVRGAENLPTGGAIVAAKHQSAFETFALIPLLANPTIVMKRADPLVPDLRPVHRSRPG